MKLKRLLTNSVTGLMLVVGVSSASNATEYTVATNGNDSNTGTNETPFRTISKCATLATAGDTCWVRAGIYRETITPSHSGRANAPISFKVFPGDKVLISGADVVSGFSNIGNGRYRANIGWDLGLGQNQVFANGKMLWEARFPNANADVMSAMKGRIANPVKSGQNWAFDDADLPSGLLGARINILPGPEWVAETGTVTKSRAGNLSFSAPYGQLKDTFYNLREGNPYMVWGHSALLDNAGEFYHDGDSLDVMVDPTTHQIEAKRRNYAFILDHRAHIVIDGFHVFAATITTGNPNPSSAGLSRYPNAATSHHIAINDVHFRYVSHFTHILPGTATSGAGVYLAWSKGMTNTGVMLFGANHSLTNSTIAFSAGNGIALAGTNHLVEDTVVHDINYSVTDGAALLAGFYDIQSSGHIVRYNSFYRGARSILTHRGVKNLKVIFNDLYDAGLVASDLGITYTYQTDGTGTEIARNLIHGNTREGDFIGIYLDNGSNGMTVHHNTVWDVTKALQLNIPSTNNIILNNTLIGNKQSVSSWTPPNLSTANISGTNLSNNIIVGERNVYGLVDSLSFDGSHNYETLNVADLQFVDVVDNDFRLLASSPAVDTGRVIEGITGNFDGALPDIGAIEGVSQTPGAGISQPCVYGDDCAPRYVVEASSNTEQTAETPPRDTPEQNNEQSTTNSRSGGGSLPLQGLLLLVPSLFFVRNRRTKLGLLISTLLLPFAFGSIVSAQAEDEWFMPKPSTTWQIQLQGDVNTNYNNAEMYDIDLYDSSEALIQQLQARGKNVICYFSAGSYEEWRPDADQFNASDLGNALDGWPGERWLDIRSNNVKEIMKKRLDLAEQKGCGGVDPDNMDGYLNESGLPINAQDQLNYNRFIAKEAHNRGLSVGLKNDLDQIDALVDHFDFAVNEQCFEFNECDLLTPFINQGKAVFQIEYDSKYTTGANAEATRNELCSDAQSLKLSTLVMPLMLDDSFRLSCLQENDQSTGEQQDGSNSGEISDTTDTDNTTLNDNTSISGGGSLTAISLLFLGGLTLRRRRALINQLRKEI